MAFSTNLSTNCVDYFFIGTEIPDPVVVTTEVNGNEVTLKWKEPENNGAVITRYSIYQRIGNEEEWKIVEVINDISKLEFVVRMEKNKQYEFVVTATNKYGESKKNKDNIKTIKNEGGTLLKMRM